MKDNADGSWTCTVREPSDVKKAYEMQAGVRAIEMERAEQVKAKWAGRKEKVQHRDGRVVEYNDENIEHVKSKVRPVGRNGVSAALFYGMSEATKRYVKGPDGLYFVWNDGWEPTNLWAPADAADRQRDPEGNAWVRDGSDWRLED